jgi:hypothetical protein
MLVSCNVSSNDFIIASGSEGPRLALISKTATIEGSGSASHVVLARSSGSTIFMVTEASGSVILVSGNIVTIPPWLNEINAGDDLDLFNDASLDLNFRTMLALDSRVTYTRTGTATYYDHAGRIAVAAANVPRLDHNPTTYAPRGLLIEEAGTNLLLRTEEFDFGAGAFAPWGFAGVSAAANVTAAPDGRMTADKIVEDTSTGTHSFQHNVSKAASASSYVLSVFAKSGGRNRITMQTYDPGDVANQVQGTFNVGNGTIAVSASATGTFTGGGQFITALPNGWYRCGITYTTNTVGSVASLWYLESDVSGITYSGDGTSGIFFWGAMMEDGKFPTSYIQSVASEGTRAADNVSMTGTNFSDWYTSATGTWYTEAENFATALATQPLLYVSDGTTNNAMIHLLADTTTSVNVAYVSGGVTQATFSTARGTPATIKIASVYTANDFAATYNGLLAGTDSSGTVPAVNKLQLGENPASAKGNLWVRRLTYWNTRKNNTFLTTLTK